VPREEIEVPIASLNQEVQGVSIGDVAVVKEADGDELEDDK